MIDHLDLLKTYFKINKMKNINIQVPEGYELKEISEGNYKVIPIPAINLDIINDTDWFYIEYNDKNDDWMVKGGILNPDAHSIHWRIGLHCPNIGGSSFDAKYIRSVRKATPEEIEDFYTKFPQYRPEPVQKTWEDFDKVEGYEIKSGFISNHIKSTSTSLNFTKGVLPTKNEAKSVLALSQLLQWRDKANGEKLEDWCDWGNGNQWKYIIRREDNKLSRHVAIDNYNVLAFKTPEIRDQFMIDHKDLLNQYFMIK